MRIAFACVLTVVITGCATITTGQNQPVSVETPGCQGATCKLSNDKGSWFVSATPGSAMVQRAYGDMTVICERGEYRSSPYQFKSSTKAMAFGNIIFGGLIGVAVDAGSGAAYDYPTLITVPMVCAGDPKTVVQPTQPAADSTAAGTPPTTTTAATPSAATTAATPSVATTATTPSTATTGATPSAATMSFAQPSATTAATPPAAAAAGTESTPPNSPPPTAAVAGTRSAGTQATTTAKTRDQTPAGAAVSIDSPQVTKSGVQALTASHVERISKHVFSAERVAKSLGCEQPVATMNSQTTSAETFTVQCLTGDLVTIRCEGSACRELK